MGMFTTRSIVPTGFRKSIMPTRFRNKALALNGTGRFARVANMTGREAFRAVKPEIPSILGFVTIIAGAVMELADKQSGGLGLQMAGLVYMYYRSWSDCLENQREIT